MKSTHRQAQMLTTVINIPQTIPPAKKQLTFQWSTKKPALGIFFKYKTVNTMSITVQVIGSYICSEEWYVFLSILNNIDFFFNFSTGEAFLFKRQNKAVLRYITSVS